MGRTRQKRGTDTPPYSGQIAALADQFTSVSGALPTSENLANPQPVKFSHAQRKVLAKMCPQLEGRLLLEQKGQRPVELTLRDLQQIEQLADEAGDWAHGSERTSARKICDIAEQLLRGAGNGLVYQLHISLNGFQPLIWRRIQVLDGTLAELHAHIQTAMGWFDSHLHEFEIRGARYSAPPPFDDGSWDSSESADATEVLLSEVVPSRPKNFRFTYLYDFGDSWEHTIKVESVGPPELGQRYPVCVAGERACPPEDCGGIWGYSELLEAITDPNHDQHDEMLEWQGSYDADAFDPIAATRQLRR